MNVEITTVVISEYQLHDQDAWLDLYDVCERCSLHPTEVEELVDLGLVTPAAGSSLDPDRWRFRSSELARLRQARRLRRELDLDWQGVAVTLELLDEIQRLRSEVESLRKQLDQR